MGKARENRRKKEDTKTTAQNEQSLWLLLSAYETESRYSELIYDNSSNLEQFYLDDSKASKPRRNMVWQP
jgi:hypothetical protein